MIHSWLKRTATRVVGTALVMALFTIAPVLPASATVPVIDIANLSQNMLTAAWTSRHRVQRAAWAARDRGRYR